MIRFDFVDWDDDDDPRGNVQHIAAADLTPDEVEDVLYSPSSESDISESSGRFVLFGTTGPGKYIIVVYARTVDGGFVFIRPITAYEVDPPS